MAKKAAAPAAAPKPAAAKPEDSFVQLMLVAADFVKSSGSLEHAKKALQDAGQFIESAGSVASANKALEVLGNLKEKIG